MDIGESSSSVRRAFETDIKTPVPSPQAFTGTER
jgi:hypothetical protein